MLSWEQKETAGYSAWDSRERLLWGICICWVLCRTTSQETGRRDRRGREISYRRFWSDFFFLH